VVEKIAAAERLRPIVLGKILLFIYKITGPAFL
jgi:hypothetical protein